MCLNCCPASPWLQNVNNYLNNNQQNSVEKEAVNFLFSNCYCGINNCVKLEDIVNYINGLGIYGKYDVISFQQGILRNLKRQGMVATIAKPGGGAFIPCDVQEVRDYTKQVLERVEKELFNMQGIYGLVGNQANNQQLQQINQSIGRLKQVI